MWIFKHIEVIFKVIYRVAQKLANSNYVGNLLQSMIQALNRNCLISQVLKMPSYNIATFFSPLQDGIRKHLYSMSVDNKNMKNITYEVALWCNNKKDYMLIVFYLWQGW